MPATTLPRDQRRDAPALVGHEAEPERDEEEEHARDVRREAVALEDVQRRERQRRRGEQRARAADQAARHEVDHHDRERRNPDVQRPADERQRLELRGDAQGRRLDRGAGRHRPDPERRGEEPDQHRPVDERVRQREPAPARGGAGRRAQEVHDVVREVVARQPPVETIGSERRPAGHDREEQEAGRGSGGRHAAGLIYQQRGGCRVLTMPRTT
jgi:hypothetical protein